MLHHRAGMRGSGDGIVVAYAILVTAATLRTAGAGVPSALHEPYASILRDGYTSHFRGRDQGTTYNETELT